MKRIYALENHPNDSRMKMGDGICQALTGRMGTGGNNTPMVLVVSESEEELNRDMISKHGQNPA